MALSIFNSAFASMVRQFDQRIGRLLWEWNKENFPKAQSRPRFVAKEVKKELSPMELSQLLAMIAPVMPLGEEDMIEIRRHTGFLPLSIPENPVHNPQGVDRAKIRKDAPEPIAPETNDSDENDDDEPVEQEDRE